MSVLPTRAEDENRINAYLGQRIRMARIAMGVSQQALAEALGLTFQQIQKYERGRNRISASRLYDIGRVLGVSIETFYEGLEEGAQGTLPSRMKDLTEAYERLSPQFGARELVELNQAFIGIKSEETRSKIIQLVELIADAEQLSNMSGAQKADRAQNITNDESENRRRIPAKLLIA